MGKKSTRIVGALALVGALVTSGPVLAVKPAKPAQPAQGGGEGLIGDLSPARDSAIVRVPVDCDPAGANQTKTTSVSVKIFQPSGRLLNIGTGSVASTVQQPICTGNQTEIDVTVNAIPGLAFKPGPATILIKLTETITTTTTTPPVAPSTGPTVTVTVDETESGARVDLRP
jgi:hypothetical protein